MMFFIIFFMLPVCVENVLVIMKCLNAVFLRKLLVAILRRPAPEDIGESELFVQPEAIDNSA